MADMYITPAIVSGALWNRATNDCADQEFETRDQESLSITLVMSSTRNFSENSYCALAQMLYSSIAN